jgi:heat-inducible transcriptional repressor
MQQLDQVISDVGKLAAELTDYPALALSAKAPATVKRFDLIYVDSNTFIIVAMLSSNAVKNKLIHLPFSVEQSMVQKLSTVFNASFTGITEDEISPVLISSTERSTGDTMGLVAVIAGFAIEILSEEKAARAVLSGEAKLLQLPEFRDPDKAHKVMNYLSDAEHLYDLPGMDFGDDIKVLIGPENIAEELKDSSVILAKYNAGDGMQGVIGVVGPTRMDYSTVAAKLSYIAGGLSKMLGSSGADKTLPGFGKLMIKDSNQ